MGNVTSSTKSWKRASGHTIERRHKPQKVSLFPSLFRRLRHFRHFRHFPQNCHWWARCCRSQCNVERKSWRGSFTVFGACVWLGWGKNGWARAWIRKIYEGTPLDATCERFVGGTECDLCHNEIRFPRDWPSLLLRHKFGHRQHPRSYVGQPDRTWMELCVCKFHWFPGTLPPHSGRHAQQERESFATWECEEVLAKLGQKRGVPRRV